MFDTNKSGIFGDVISSDGRVVWDVPVDAGPSGQFGPVAISRHDATEVTLTPTAAMRAFGIDMLSGYSFLYFGAPVGATNLSPVTTLLRSVDDDLVAANTGLGLSARELSTFAAVPAMSSSDTATAALGRRVTAYNLKLAALAALSQPASEAILPDYGFRFDTLQALLGEIFRLGRVDLNSASTIRALMERMPYTSQQASSDRGRAIAALLARYGAAVDMYLTDQRRAADVQHGYRLVVLPAILDIQMRGNPVADADTITTDMLVAAFHEFAEIPAPKIETRPYVRNTIIHSLVAVTDLRSIARVLGSDSITLRADCSLGGGDYSSPLCNDVGVASVGSIGLDRTELRLGAVRVPDKFAGRLSVTLEPSGEIEIRRLNGAVGLVWFEYDVVHANGLKATGRTYVRLDLSR
ncbi:hypothetical protein [Sphingopyxis sp. R3-92]|uniref:hypothetical protein n=1 Tax=Sphingopyxis sp. R3-92 TaxID=3158553 RepID=UPI003EE4F4EE